jgi:cellulose synthase/poly-beta-1,6-N-acetylglucosamine synthase-like glycosyltransferase
VNQLTALTAAPWFQTAVSLGEGGFLVYVAAMNLIYLLLTLLGFFALRGRYLRLNPQERTLLGVSPMVPRIAVLVPAYNEEATIADSVRAMLTLRYPNYETIVVNDGSKDNTLEILIETFRLYKSSRYFENQIPCKPIRGVYESHDPVSLVVIDKENGGKADSLNAAINVARSDLIATVDADSLLDPDALLLGVQPFLEDPARTIASSGIVRVVNGCEVEHGRIVALGSPHSEMARFQIVEYFRAFLGSRVALSFMNALLIISGTFGLFNRRRVVEAGGFRTDTVGEDMEMVVKLHHRARKEGRKYRIVFVPDPVCWTMVPEVVRVLRRQRNRWQRGMTECLLGHAAMFMNPRYGAVGLFAIPFFVAFEMLGPVVELSGYLFTAIGLALGIVNLSAAVAYLIVSVAFGIFLSASALLSAEFTRRRYPSLALESGLFGAALLDGLGFRQLLCWWRFRGLIDALRGKRGWGTMERQRFGGATAGSAGGKG